MRIPRLTTLAMLAALGASAQKVAKDELAQMAKKQAPNLEHGHPRHLHGRRSHEGRAFAVGTPVATVGADVVAAAERLRIDHPVEAVRRACAQRPAVDPQAAEFRREPDSYPQHGLRIYAFQFTPTAPWLAKARVRSRLSNGC